MESVLAEHEAMALPGDSGGKEDEKVEVRCEGHRLVRVRGCEEQL